MAAGVNGGTSVKVNVLFVVACVMLITFALIFLFCLGAAFSSLGDDQWRALGMAGVICLPCLMGLLMLQDALELE